MGPVTRSEPSLGSARASSGSQTAYWLLFFGVLALMLWPMLSIRYPGMADYPVHLARVFILRTWAVNPVFQQRYQIVRAPFPNLAIDLLAGYVFRFANIYAAGKLALSTLVILF